MPRLRGWPVAEVADGSMMLASPQHLLRIDPSRILPGGIKEIPPMAGISITVP